MAAALPLLHQQRRDGSQPGPTGQPDGSFQAGLAQRESSNNPAAFNSAGYAGLYQFGTQRLATLGMYHPALGESTTTNQWKGSVSIPGFPQVQTVSQFLGNPAAQNAAYSAHMADIDSAIAATPGAQNFDQNGLRAVAHLGGTGAMQQFVASGGKANATDSNSTSWANYYNRFSAPGSTPVRVASAANTAGMPQTANDASPGAACDPCARDCSSRSARRARPAAVRQRAKHCQPRPCRAARVDRDDAARAAGSAGQPAQRGAALRLR